MNVRIRKASQSRYVEADNAGGRDAFALDARLLDDLTASDESRALRHAFLGERAVQHIPGLSISACASDIRTVGVVGGGLMGTGIATAVLKAGRDAILVEPRADALDRARASIGKTLSRDVHKGRMDHREADARMVG